MEKIRIRMEKIRIRNPEKHPGSARKTFVLLQVLYNGEWLEVLGCGVMEQEILSQAGVV